MGSLITEIEIRASPAVVRAKFLDFKQLSNYHQSFIKSVACRPNDAQKEGKDLVEGDKVIATMDGLGALEVVIVEATPHAFSWRGKIPGVFTGHHFFHFKPSAKTPGGTTFEHGEDFSGALSFAFGESWVATTLRLKENSKKKYAAFTVDLKAWCEQ